MCGLLGVVRNGINDPSKERRSLDTMKHRGPDQWGEWYNDRVYIGHRRLSILDLSESGRQPMISGKIILTVNGEIYNYLPLKEELKKKYSFKSKSDSEVLLYGYREWGIRRLLEKIEGMFSFVIYDGESNEIFLARDRAGIKPLYYGYENNVFIWSSELKAIREYFGETELKKDQTAIYDFYTYLYIPAPKTLYENIRKLEPGHYVKYSVNRNSIEKFSYWKLEPGNNLKITPEKAAEQLRYLVEKSVSDQMMSHVPVGFFLSGGIDSSVVVESAVKTNDIINTYTIGFDVSDYNENEYAGIVAGLLGTNHLEKILDSSRAAELLEKIPGWYDEPFADTSAVPTFLVSEFAKTGSTVVLTGDGGDEIFGGYKWYDKFMRNNNSSGRFLKIFMKSISNIRARNSYSMLGRTLNRVEYFYASELELYAKLLGGLMKHQKSFLREKYDISNDYDDYWYFRKYDRPDLSARKRLQYIDFHTYLPDDILTKVDRASMQVSLECRVPLLDTGIIEFMFSLPEEMVYFNGQLKGLLKLAYRDILPENILHRPKHGFSIPVRHWQHTSSFRGFHSNPEMMQSLYQLD